MQFWGLLYQTHCLLLSNNAINGTADKGQLGGAQHPLTQHSHWLDMDWMACSKRPWYPVPPNCPPQDVLRDKVKDLLNVSSTHRTAMAPRVSMTRQRAVPFCRTRTESVLFLLLCVEVGPNIYSRYYSNSGSFPIWVPKTSLQCKGQDVHLPASGCHPACIAQTTVSFPAGG